MRKVPQRTVAKALEVLELTQERLAGVAPGSAEQQRLSAAIIELQQVVSMLSDAAHQTPDAVARGRKTIEAARQLIGDVDRHSANEPGA
jgi:hypothetical protein